AEPEEFVEAGAVVLAAGAYGSPGILMRSGIGPAALLSEMGVDVRADVRGGRPRGAGCHPRSLVPDHGDVAQQIRGPLRSPRSPAVRIGTVRHPRRSGVLRGGGASQESSSGPREA